MRFPTTWVRVAVATVAVLWACEQPTNPLNPDFGVVSVAVNPSHDTLLIGDSVQLTATVVMSNNRAPHAVNWTTSASAIASVSGTGMAHGLGVGSARILATSANRKDSALVTVVSVPPVPVMSVVVNPASSTVRVGGTERLTATPEDANGNSLAGRTITWATSNAAIAGVDATGLVMGVAAGPATITATSEGKSGTASVTVALVPVASVTVSPASGSIVVGGTIQLMATTKDSAGNTLTGRSITWASSNTSTATVSATGLVTGVAAGAATITATSEGKSATATVTVAVALVPVASVTVSPATASLFVGATKQLSATTKDSAGNVLTGRAIAWSSSNTTAATVISSGLVTGKATGSATITATSEGKSGTASITVALVPVASVTVSPASGSIAVGGTVQLTATTKDSAGNVLTGRAITWSSGNLAAATVSASGLVTGVAAGMATITATSEGKSGTASVTVTTGGSGGFGHVIIVAEENHDYASVIGSSAMPYLNGLSTQYGLATNYYANAHPSIGNYFEVSTGDTIINDDNFTGTVNNDNVVRELVKAGKTWKAYIEGYPSYDANHVPMSYFSDIRNNSTQAANMVAFTQFATDLANGTLPQFSFITPDLCNDAHNCSLSTADAWLQTNIDPLIKSALFQKDGLLVIWWDESASDNRNGGGQVAWTVVSPFAKRGYRSTTLYQHQSTLRLTLKALGVSVFPGQAATAPDMDEFFTIPVAPAPRVP